MNKEQLKYFSSSKKQDWETPDFVFDMINAEFGFTIDVCATEENKKCDRFYSEDENGLLQDWTNEIVYMNPPYKDCAKWMKKAFDESKKGATVVCLVPSRTDSNWFHQYAMKGEIRFFERRLPFVKNGKPIKYEKAWCGYQKAPFPSALVIFRPPQFEIKLQQIEIPLNYKDKAV